MQNILETKDRQSINTATNEAKPLQYFSWWLPVFGIVWSLLYFSFIPDPLTNLGRYYPLIGIGFGAGILANISAIGGGLVLIPVMLFIFHFPAVMALKATLASQSIALTSGSIAWFQTGKVNAKLLLYAIPGLIIGSTISSLIIHPNAFLVKTIFGPVSILIGIIAVLTLDSKVQKIRPPHSLPLFLISVLGGLITGWISIGEGEVIAAYLMLACGVSAPSSIGLGVVLLAINSIYLTLIHSVFLGGIPWHIACLTMLGAVYGARLAPYLSQWINQRLLKMVFAFIAIADGILFIVQAYLHGIK